MIKVKEMLELPEFVSLLGKISDRDIAVRFNVGNHVVHRCRAKLKIPAYIKETKHVEQINFNPMPRSKFNEASYTRRHINYTEEDVHRLLSFTGDEYNQRM